jgi:hypothetical protein
MALHHHRDAQQWHLINGSQPSTDGAVLLCQDNAPRGGEDTILRVRVQGSVQMGIGGTINPPDYFLGGLRWWVMVKFSNDIVPSAPNQPQSTDGIMATEMLTLRSLTPQLDPGEAFYQYEMPETLVTEGMRKGDGSTALCSVSVWLYMRDQYNLMDSVPAFSLRFETSGLATFWWGTTVTP